MDILIEYELDENRDNSNSGSTPFATLPQIPKSRDDQITIDDAL